MVNVKSAVGSVMDSIVYAVSDGYCGDYYLVDIGDFETAEFAAPRCECPRCIHHPRASRPYYGSQQAESRLSRVCGICFGGMHPYAVFGQGELVGLYEHAIRI